MSKLESNVTYPKNYPYQDYYPESKVKYYVEIGEITTEESEWLEKIVSKKNEWTLEDLIAVGGVRYYNNFLENAINHPSDIDMNIHLLNNIIIGTHKDKQNTMIITNSRAGLNTVSIAANILKSFLNKFRPYYWIRFECLELEDSTTYNNPSSVGYLICSRYIKTYSLKDWLDTAELTLFKDMKKWKK